MCVHGTNSTCHLACLPLKQQSLLQIESLLRRALLQYKVQPDKGSK